MENTKASVILCLALFLVISSASAFDIVKLLEKQSELSSFTNYLKETKLGDEINKRSTITVLAVDNGGMSSISGKSQDVIKKILSAHVVLDYFDQKKLTGLAGSSKESTLTTMLQSSGQAKDQQGFIIVGKSDGEIAFGSAVKGGKLNAKLVKAVVSQPYNISVLQISNAIEIPDISAASSPAGSPKSSASPASSPSSKSSSDAPSPSDDSAPSQSPKSSKAPSPSDEVSSPPVSGDATPSSSPSSDGPTGSSSSAPSPSAASRAEMAFGAGVVIMGLASLLVA
ncbi:hypothetical protein C1H46_003794 [Malus baccata]|uniref:FAS1 domain-containing protein n=1 Tax=Malus baccata TaxID=106549 RepID=A0A540NHP8_MALBA|nr:hypothetical protein C1H46_003794 [Malus baccata]